MFFYVHLLGQLLQVIAGQLAVPVDQPLINSKAGHNRWHLKSFGHLVVFDGHQFTVNFQIEIAEGLPAAAEQADEKPDDLIALYSWTELSQSPNEKQKYRM